MAVAAADAAEAIVEIAATGAIAATAGNSLSFLAGGSLIRCVGAASHLLVCCQML
jgi:hypothetical protein